MFHLIIFVIGLPGFLHSQKIGNNQKGGFPDYAVLGPGPVLPESSPQSRVEKCGTILLDECLKDLQTFLRLTHLPFTSKNNELDELCSQAIHGYNCSVDAITSNCLKGKDSEIVPLFIDMAQYTFLMMCGNGYDSRGYLEEAFLEHSECILKHKSEMECCAQETRIPDLPILRILEQSSKSLPERQILACCPVARYMKCTNEVVNRYCGEAAANFTSEYIFRASGEQLQAMCQRMPGYPNTESKMCPDPIPKCSGSWTILPNSVSMVLSILMMKFYLVCLKIH